MDLCFVPQKYTYTMYINLNICRDHPHQNKNNSKNENCCIDRGAKYAEIRSMRTITIPQYCTSFFYVLLYIGFQTKVIWFPPVLAIPWFCCFVFQRFTICGNFHAEFIFCLINLAIHNLTSIKGTEVVDNSTFVLQNTRAIYCVYKNRFDKRFAEIAKMIIFWLFI